MQLEHIAGNTYYIDGPSIIGVYIFKNHSCLLVDSGDSKENAVQVLKVLKENRLKLYGIINTHSHADHCSGNCLMQEQTGCKIYASKLDAVIMENPRLIVYGLYSASPLKALQNKYLIAQPCVVTDMVKPGQVLINEAAFQVMDLRGHGIGQIGIITPDGVAFVGDSLISPEILESYTFLYMMDIQLQINTLNYIEASYLPTVFLSHGGLVDNLALTIKQNKNLLERLIKFSLEVLVEPKSREQVVQEIAREFNLPMNRTQYFLISSSVSAFLSYLCNTRQAGCWAVEGTLKFARDRTKSGQK